MRKEIAAALNDAAPDDLLTTGEAAALLGTSRQHVVDLCNSGDLRFTTAGKHRRVRRGDIESLRDASHRLNRDQLRSLLLAFAVAGKVVADPERTVAEARRNLRNLMAHAPRGSANIWLEEWERLLEGSLPDLLEALTSRSPRSRELRQNSPFAGVLSNEERLRVLAALPASGSREFA